jgi:peptidyl-prolyl cis-trans isomerase SurA
MQEIQRRKIAVPDIDVAHAIGDIERRNNLPAGGLQAKLSGQGVSPSTLIAQIRTQLGWTRVLRQELSERGRITQNEIAEQEKIFKKEQGQPQYRLAEIFVAAEDPAHLNDARKFADTVIQQLHAGAPFGIGWMRADQLDPAVTAVVTQMPVGAVTNPVRVPGGFDVVTLLEKRQVGSDLATVLTLRQAFYPFTSQLDPQNPTPEQRKALADGQALSKNAHSCADMEVANKAAGSIRATDPGPVRLDRLSGPMQNLLGSLAEGQASKALVTNDGILVVMVCKREQKNMAAMSRDDIANQLLEERVELASRQLQQDLKRRALIDQRS